MAKKQNNSDLNNILTNKIQEAMQKAKVMKEKLTNPPPNSTSNRNCINTTQPPAENNQKKDVDNFIKDLNRFGSNFEYPNEDTTTDNIMNSNYPMPIDNIGQPLSNLTNLDFFNEQNHVRQNPKSLVPYLQSKLQYFDGNVLWELGKSGGVQTQEGPKAVQEAIGFLLQANPLKPFELKNGLSMSAEDHAKDIGETG